MGILLLVHGQTSGLGRKTKSLGAYKAICAQQPHLHTRSSQPTKSSIRLSALTTASQVGQGCTCKLSMQAQVHGIITGVEHATAVLWPVQWVHKIESGSLLQPVRPNPLGPVSCSNHTAHKTGHPTQVLTFQRKSPPDSSTSQSPPEQLTLGPDGLPWAHLSRLPHTAHEAGQPCARTGLQPTALFHQPELQMLGPPEPQPQCNARGGRSRCPGQGRPGRQPARPRAGAPPQPALLGLIPGAWQPCPCLLGLPASTSSLHRVHKRGQDKRSHQFQPAWLEQMSDASHGSVAGILTPASRQ